MQAMFARVKEHEETPWLVEFVRTYMETFPDERMQMIQAFNDLTRGVFVDGGARDIWRRHYLAALRLDLKGLDVPGMMKARKTWNERVAADPAVLLSRLGPQVACEVKSVMVKLEAFGESSRLRFDINTAELGVLNSIPGMTGELTRRWMDERARQPFVSLTDLEKRTGFSGCAK